MTDQIKVSAWDLLALMRSQLTRLAETLAAHDAVQTTLESKIQALLSRIEMLKEYEERAKWYESLVSRAQIGTKETPSLKAYVEQLEARCQRQEDELEAGAWTTSQAMAEAKIDQQAEEIEKLKRDARWALETVAQRSFVLEEVARAQSLIRTL